MPSKLWFLLILFVAVFFAFRTGYVEGLHYGHNAANRGHLEQLTCPQ